MTISAQGRAAFEAFQATKAGIGDQYAARAAAGSAEPTPTVKPFVRDQNAALSVLKESNTRLQNDLESLKKEFQTRARSEADERDGAEGGDFRSRFDAGARFASDDDAKPGRRSDPFASGQGAFDRSRVDPAVVDGLKAYRRTLSSVGETQGN